MIDQHVLKAEERMKKIIEATRKEFASIRSGKASPALLDGVKVDAYGSMVPLNQVGAVSAPEVRLLVVQPWDKGLVRRLSTARPTVGSRLNRRTGSVCAVRSL